MKLDRSVNVGTLIHLAGVIITLFVLYTGVVARLTTIETKVDAMWKWFSARQDRLDGRPP